MLMVIAEPAAGDCAHRGGQAPAMRTAKTAAKTLNLDKGKKDTKAMAGRHEDWTNPRVATDAMAENCEINNVDNVNNRENDT